jgi:hypothetical protein
MVIIEKMHLNFETMPRFERKITLQEAEDIRHIMIECHRLDGFIRKDIDNKIVFSVDKSFYGGSLITLSDLDLIIQARKIEVEG